MPGVAGKTKSAAVEDETVDSERHPAHFSTLFIAIVCGTVVLLLLLLVFGVAWKQGNHSKCAESNVKICSLYCALFQPITCYTIVAIMLVLNFVGFISA